MQENKINIEYISYDQLKQIEEHAKEYSTTYDKISFLKNVSPYEQKIILLKSLNPYEVLENLSNIDSKNTRLVLDSLTYDEIKNIINLFSSEDKKTFYTNFSDLELVNQFIKQDTNSNNYIKDLTLDRKVELINNADSRTIEATNEIYKSMTSDEQAKATSYINDSSAISVVSEINDNVSEESKETTIDEIENLEETQEIEQIEEIKEEIEENKEEFDQINDLKNEFIKSNIQYYINNEDFNNINLQDITYLNLPEELRILIDKDYDLYQNKLKNKEETQEEILEEFNKEKENCEKNYINEKINKDKVKVTEEETIQFQKVI